MTKQIIPTEGMRFNHSRVLSTVDLDGKTPQLFEVTRVARGTAYYRPVYNLGTRETLGSTSWCPVEQFGRWVQSVVA